MSRRRATWCSPEVGDKRFQVIKVVRATTGMRLKAVKALVDGASSRKRRAGAEALAAGTGWARPDAGGWRVGAGGWRVIGAGAPSPAT
jgi:hypothetical protein